MVEKVLVSKKNDTFKFWNVKQRKGERFVDFTHRFEVAVLSCGYNKDDIERHVRHQIVFRTSINSLREKALSDNLELDQIKKNGNAV